MKLTKQELATIAQEELRALLKEIKLKPKKLSKHAMGTEMGSKEKPCQKPGGGNYSTGNRLFDPHVQPGSKEEWECNTAIEDELHHAVARFISGNSTRGIEGRIGDFILKHFENMTDPNLPLHRFTKSTPLYRGSGRIFNNYGFEFLKEVDWSKGVEAQKGITRYPFNGVYKLRRPVSSFSDDFNSAADFMESNSDKDCIFLYETKGNTRTANGGFFLDLIGMYMLDRNDDYTMSNASGKPIRFNDVGSFANESEVLLIGADAGDTIDVDYVYINTDHLNTRMGRLQELNPELHDMIRNHIEFSPKDIELAKKVLAADIRFVKNAFELYIPELKALGDMNKVDVLIYRMQKKIKQYINKERIYKVIKMENEYKKFMADLGKLYKDLQSLKPAPKEWGAKSFEQ